MPSKTVLTKLLHVLVQEWGREEVEAAFNALGASTELSGHPSRESSPRKRQAVKLKAAEQVERAHLPESAHRYLLELALRFDQKDFLPSTSDIREFLLMMGQRPGAIKDRSEGFKRLLHAFSEVPPERLEQLALMARHSGPSQLGPLSDAISSTAASLASRRRPGPTETQS